MVQEIVFQPDSIDFINKHHATLCNSFKAGKCRSLEFRRAQLLQLARMLQQNSDAFAAAIGSDAGKPKQEALGMEVGAIIERCLICVKSLQDWTKPQSVDVPDWQKSWNPTVYPTPKGPVLIIAPWNYPCVLSLQALYAAIAAGCPAIVKPSEFAPAYSNLLATLLPKFLDPDAYAVVQGAVTETTRLLELKWAHIFYTGNGRVARIVATAAAKHLTPCSLELGGKSPAFVDPEYDLKLAAKRILFGKTANAGQTCVAPDYVLVTEDKKEALTEALKEVLQDFYPQGDFNSDSYGHIVSLSHFKRLQNMLSKTKGKIVRGGNSDAQTLKFENTIVIDVDGDDELMQDEIFGPILPIVAVANVDAAIDFINSRDNALSIYVFTENPVLKNKLREETLSGSIIYNETMGQLSVNELPFSGIGESGYGNQVLKYGFDGFTLLRSSIDIPKEVEEHMWMRYPPYSDDSLKIMAATVNIPIPSK